MGFLGNRKKKDKDGVFAFDYQFDEQPDLITEAELTPQPANTEIRETLASVPAPSAPPVLIEIPSPPPPPKPKLTDTSEGKSRNTVKAEPQTKDEDKPEVIRAERVVSDDAVAPEADARTVEEPAPVEKGEEESIEQVDVEQTVLAEAQDYGEEISLPAPVEEQEIEVPQLKGAALVEMPEGGIEIEMPAPVEEHEIEVPQVIGAQLSEKAPEPIDKDTFVLSDVAPPPIKPVKEKREGPITAFFKKRKQAKAPARAEVIEHIQEVVVPEPSTEQPAAQPPEPVIDEMHSVFPTTEEAVSPEKLEHEASKAQKRIANRQAKEERRKQKILAKERKKKARMAAKKKRQEEKQAKAEQKAKGSKSRAETKEEKRKAKAAQKLDKAGMRAQKIQAKQQEREKKEEEKQRRELVKAEAAKKKFLADDKNKPVEALSMPAREGEAPQPVEVETVLEPEIVPEVISSEPAGTESRWEKRRAQKAAKRAAKLAAGGQEPVKPTKKPRKGKKKKEDGLEEGIVGRGDEIKAFFTSLKLRAIVATESLRDPETKKLSSRQAKQSLAQKTENIRRVPLSQRMKTRYETVGLDIGSNYLRAARVRDGVAIEVHERPLPHGIFDDGKLQDQERLTREIKELWIDGGFTSRRVNFSISNKHINYKLWYLRAESDADRREAIATNAPMALSPMDTSKAIIDYTELALANNGWQVSLAAAERDVVKKLTDAVEAAGLVAVSCELAPLAACRALDIPRTTTAAHVVCDIGGDNTKIAMVSGADILAVYIIPIGGNDFTAAVVSSTGLDWEEAEALKVSCGLTNDRTAEELSGEEYELRIRACDSMVPVADRLAQEIKVACDTYQHQRGGRAVSAINLIGGGSRLKGLPQHLNLFTGFSEIAPLRPEAGFDHIADFELSATALGLATDHTMSLLPAVSVSRMNVAMPGTRAKPRISSSGKTRAKRLSLSGSSAGSGAASFSGTLIGVALGIMVFALGFQYSRMLNSDLEQLRPQKQSLEAEVAARESRPPSFVYVGGQSGLLSTLAGPLSVAPDWQMLGKVSGKAKQDGVPMAISVEAGQIILSGRTGQAKAAQFAKDVESLAAPRKVTVESKNGVYTLTMAANVPAGEVE